MNDSDDLLVYSGEIDGEDRGTELFGIDYGAERDFSERQVVFMYGLDLVVCIRLWHEGCEWHVGDLAAAHADDPVIFVGK